MAYYTPYKLNAEVTPMKAFVTGGTGFIGGHLIKRLLRDGISVKALAREPIKAGNLRKLGAEPVIG
ncbi:MAG TPA: NAD-dependent epimerase/dehydratase family protein, partial [Thermodesulfobacteriota bacterium]|nr:NAD-dependent epimerase/dehydratase family protein [Thermodesulfobacteriota bacterium]